MSDVISNISYDLSRRGFFNSSKLSTNILSQPRDQAGRSDLHFSTAGSVKQTLTPPSDKTESGIRLYSASALW